MKKLAIILCGFAALARVDAQQPVDAGVPLPGASPTATPLPPVMEATQAFSMSQGKNNPFFNEKLAYQQELESEARSDAPRGYAIYPRPSQTEHTVMGEFTGFFTGMFASVNLGNKKPQIKTAAKYLAIQPAKFSLQDRHEVSANYMIRNTSGKMVRLEYANGQRLELITTDATGKLIDRWSDDRTFDPQEGIVIINPGERIEYSEKIPTRDMQPGQTYKVQAQATTTSSPYYSTTTTVTPDAAPVVIAPVLPAASTNSLIVPLPAQ